MNPFEKAREHVRIAMTLENVAARGAEVSKARYAIMDARAQDSDNVALMDTVRVCQDDLMASDYATDLGLLPASDAFLRAVEHGLTKCMKLSWIEEAMQS